MRGFKFQEGKDIKIVQSSKNDGTEYVEDGDIRLIFRDGVYVGWYMPGKKDGEGCESKTEC
jgi:hypothetical protein